MPCTATAAIAIDSPLIESSFPEFTAELTRLPANGAVSNRGYAGKTQTGVIVCIGKMLRCHVRACQVTGRVMILDSLQRRPKDQIYAGTGENGRDCPYPEHDFHGIKKPWACMWDAVLADVDEYSPHTLRGQQAPSGISWGTDWVLTRQAGHLSAIISKEAYRYWILMYSQQPG